MVGKFRQSWEFFLFRCPIRTFLRNRNRFYQFFNFIIEASIFSLLNVFIRFDCFSYCHRSHTYTYSILNVTFLPILSAHYLTFACAENIVVEILDLRCVALNCSKHLKIECILSIVWWLEYAYKKPNIGHWYELIVIKIWIINSRHSSSMLIKWWFVRPCIL